MRRTTTKRIHGVLLHDGGVWRLYREGSEPQVALRRGAELSEDMLTAISNTTGLTVLFAGEIVALETVRRTRGSFAKESARLGRQAAETLGREASEVVALPMTGTWRGHHGALTLVSPLERLGLETLNEVFQESQTTVTGYGSFEFAVLDWWMQTGDVKAKTLLVIGESTTFVIPAARLGNPGPHTISGGLRHYVQDPPSWTARVIRELGTTPGSIALLALDRCEELVLALKVEGVENLESLEACAVVADVMAGLAGLRRNSLRSRVPLVQPYAPTRLFSPVWTVLATFALWAAVLAIAFVRERVLEQRHESLVRESAAYVPLEEKIKAAEKRKSAAAAEVSRTESFRKAIVVRRKPLDLFINVSYFFCRNSGATVRLESLVESEAALTVEGTFLDPEDGVRLTEKLSSFLKEKGLQLVRIDMRDEVDEQGRTLSRFTCVIAAGGAK